MELIDLYTREVGRHLPEKMRADIEKEIRSLIEDTLEDESQQAGRAPDEALVVEVLTRLGPPEKMAASYLPPRYLIGPELYPHFLNTLRVVLAVVLVLAAIGIGVALGAPGNAPANIFDVVQRVIFGLADAMFNATAVVVLIYAAIQFAQPNLKIEAKVWDPRKLRAEPDPERVSIPDAIAKVVFNVLALVVFNFYSQWIGFATIVGGQWVHASVLAAAFFRYLPWLSLVWVLEAGLYVWVLAQGRWLGMQRWAAVGISALNIGVLAWMLTGPPILDLSGVWVRFGAELTASEIASITAGVNTSVRLVLGLVLALEVVEAGKQLYKLLRNRLPDPLIVRP